MRGTWQARANERPVWASYGVVQRRRWNGRAADLDAVLRVKIAPLAA
jgi:hypothetical protein